MPTVRFHADGMHMTGRLNLLFPISLPMIFVCLSD